MNLYASFSPRRRAADDDLSALKPMITQQTQQAHARVGEFGEIKLMQVTCSENLNELPGMQYVSKTPLCSASECHVSQGEQAGSRTASWRVSRRPDLGKASEESRHDQTLRRDPSFQ